MYSSLSEYKKWTKMLCVTLVDENAWYTCNGCTIGLGCLDVGRCPFGVSFCLPVNDFSKKDFEDAYASVPVVYVFL